MKASKHRVRPGESVKLDKVDSRVDGGLDEDEGKERVRGLSERLVRLQETMYAEGKHALLVVFQAMDAGGKDSTIRHVIGPLNPAGVRVKSFKAPSSLELRHDYLWRVHANAPERGYVRVFNRSHYEDVLIVRVKEFVERSRWKRRFDHINAFEKMLTDEGTTIVKFYLHISKDYQKERLQRRLDRPDKHWKFNPADLEERARWDDYMKAFEDVLEKCSTEHAPWYIVPSERRWYRDLVVTQVLVDIMESWKMKFPEPTFDPENITIE